MEEIKLNKEEQQSIIIEKAKNIDPNVAAKLERQARKYLDRAKKQHNFNRELLQRISNEIN